MKEKNPKVRIVLADPPGSALHSYVKTGNAVMSAGPSITEGIGNSRVTDNLAGTEIDDAVQISDQQTVSMVYRMLREEGWFFGSSTGLNLAAAVRSGARSGSRPHRRHPAVRRRRQVSVAPVQPRLARRARSEPRPLAPSGARQGALL